MLVDVRHHVPSVLLWSLYFTLFYIFENSYLPLLLGIAYVFDFPVTAPKRFEYFLRVFIPYRLLYPLEPRPAPTRRGSAVAGKRASIPGVASPNPSTSALSAPSAGPPAPSGPPDLSGSWERHSVENLDALLIAQGLSYVHRQFAKNLVMQWSFVPSADKKHLRFCEKGGPIFTDNCYEIGTLRKVVARDPKADFWFDEKIWIEGNVVKRTREQMPTKLYHVEQVMSIQDGGQSLLVNWTCTPKDKPAFTGSIIFKSIGPSPYPPPDVPAAVTDDAAS